MTHSPPNRKNILGRPPPRVENLCLPNPSLIAKRQKIREQTRDRQARHAAKCTRERDPSAQIMGAGFLAVLATVDARRAKLYRPVVEAWLGWLIEHDYDPVRAARRLKNIRKRLLAARLPKS